MVVKIRCSVCGKTVVAARTAGDCQKVCGKECRRKRNRMLARKRRRAQLSHYQQDEVRRKREQRARQKEERRPLTAGQESAACPGSTGCHAPGSADNLPKVLAKVDQIMDEAWAMSRARFRKELEQMILSAAAQSQAPPARAGP